MLFPYVVIEMLHLHKSKPAVAIKFLTSLDLLPLLRKEKQKMSQDDLFSGFSTRISMVGSAIWATAVFSSGVFSMLLNKNVLAYRHTQIQEP